MLKMSQEQSHLETVKPGPDLAFGKGLRSVIARSATALYTPVVCVCSWRVVVMLTSDW